jgi:hypothetical protein
MIGTAELVLFAIQSAIRLAEASRRAFVDSTQSRALTLPLPNFGGTVDDKSAARFYRSDKGREFNVEGSRIRTLTDRVSGGATLEEPERSEYVDFYLEDRAMAIFREGRTTDLRAGSQAGVSAQDWQHLLQIRQWQKGRDPNPSPVQRIAGTLVEIGVDYFQKDPSLVRTDRPTGKALATFLAAIDGVSFSTEKPARLAVSLFGALAEAVQANPGLFADDEPSRRLVHNVTTALAGDAQARIEAAGDTASEESIEGWARLVFRSILRSTGETILSAPELYLGARDGGATLAGNVGLAVLDAVVGRNTVDLRALFTQEAMDGVMKAALRAVAASPKLAGIPHQGVAQLVRSVVGDLAASTTVVGPDLLPEVIRIVLDRTAENADALLPAGGAPTDLLLARAGRTLLEGLAAPDPGGTWRPRFAKQDVLNTLEAVVGEVAQNPGWLSSAAGASSSHLGMAVRAALAALAGMEEPRLRPASALVVVRAAVDASARRLALLEVSDTSASPPVQRALEVVFAALRGGPPAAQWALGRDEVVTLVAVEALRRLADRGVTAARIEAVRGALVAEREQLIGGGPLDLDGLGSRLGEAIARA